MFQRVLSDTRSTAFRNLYGAVEKDGGRTNFVSFKNESAHINTRISFHFLGSGFLPGTSPWEPRAVNPCTYTHTHLYTYTTCRSRKYARARSVNYYIVRARNRLRHRRASSSSNPVARIQGYRVYPGTDPLTAHGGNL